MNIDSLVGIGLICGHMVGDYIVQNDWLAKNKTNPHPGRRPESFKKTHDGKAVMSDTGAFAAVEFLAWHERYRNWWRGHLACTVHCLLYTLAVWVCACWWMPWWGLVVCFLAHWPVDRFGLAGKWMRNVSGQAYFASKDHSMFPMSVVLVDNTFHLLVLFWIALAHVALQ